VKRLIEAVVDLIYPPEAGESPIPFWRKAMVFVLLVLTLVLAVLLS
jgi:hypothetical protein